MPVRPLLSKLFRGIAIIAPAFLVLLAALFALLEFVVFPTDRAVSSELKFIESPRQGKLPFSGYDFVCLGFRQTEFSDESLRLGQGFLRYGQCGVAGSCCNISSDGGVIVGLVKDNGIRCVQNHGVTIALSDDRAFCARPNNLVVRKRIYGAPDLLPPRYGIMTVGTSYYEFGESRKQAMASHSASTCTP